MKVLSLYCGGGGIDEGLKQAGIKTTLAIDVWKDAIETIKLNHDCETIVGKVGDYLESFNDFDIVVGGPPCPEFSRANINRTLDMCEVNNFWSVVERCKPKYYLMENVQDVNKKLIKHNFLINMADYGVPQKRERRFYTNLELPRHTHSEKPQTNLFGEKQKKWISIKEALGLTGIIQNRKSTFEEEEYREYSTDEPSITILTDSRIWFYKDVLEKQHEPMNLNKPSRTITLPHEFGDDVITDGIYCRKLTSHEKQILQGFPKDYKFHGTKNSVETQIGNAVPPSPIREFFKQVII